MGQVYNLHQKLSLYVSVTQL